MKRVLYGLAVTVCALGVAGCSKKASLTVVSYGGGAYHDSHVTAFLEPFAEQSGVHVEGVVWDANYGRLKAMVESGKVTWDVVEVTDAQFQRGVREGLYQELSRPVDPTGFLDGSLHPAGAANVYWGTVLASRAAAFPDGPPTDWADFWDPVAFPGRRALHNGPRGNLEFALLADGVPKTRLYPLDVERAFRKLDEIKPYVRVWWTDGTQPVQLLQTEAVDLTSAWNGRIFALAPKFKSQLNYSWYGAALELDWWVIPQGSDDVDLATDFIHFASQPAHMAAQAEMIGYGPVNTDALSKIDEHIRRELPTAPANWEKAFVINSDWWAQNEDELADRWLAWKNL